jgi:hypothetical protein
MNIMHRYDYPFGSDEYATFRDRMYAAGHRLVIRYERNAPETVEQCWPMNGTYLTERGAMVHPWVEFAGPKRGPHRGYWLEGVAPLPVAAKPKAAPVPTARPIKRPDGKAKQAAHYFVLTPIVSRQDAADRFGVSVAALGVALRRHYRPEQIPLNRPGMATEQRKIAQRNETSATLDAVDWIADGPLRTVRDAAIEFNLHETTVTRALNKMRERKPSTYDMARWLERHPEASRHDASRLFGYCYRVVCRVLRFRNRPANPNNMSADEINDRIRWRWPEGRPLRKPPAQATRHSQKGAVRETE